MNKSFINIGKAIVGLLFICSINACHTEPDSAVPAKKKGYRPVYISYEEMRNVQTKLPQPLNNPGKIYIKGKYIFINEINKGIHVIDNHNPSLPKPVSFISIPGNVDMAVKQNVLYADNSTDLIALDISNPNDVKLLKRIKDTFPYRQYPPNSGYFECVDPSRGIVSHWESVELKNPKCFR